MKLIAWTDRNIEKRAKDASDVHYLIKTYSDIPQVEDELYAGGYMEAQDWDQTFASAVKLGVDTGAIASQDAVDVVQQELFHHENNKVLFARDMLGEPHVIESDSAMTLLDRFIDGFTTGVRGH